jgi:hypothetical protein
VSHVPSSLMLRPASMGVVPSVVVSVAEAICPALLVTW